MCITRCKDRVWDLEGRPDDLDHYQVEALRGEIWSEDEEGGEDTESLDEVDTMERYMAEIDAQEQEDRD